MPPIVEMDSFDMLVAPGWDGSTDWGSGYDENNPHPVHGMG